MKGGYWYQRLSSSPVQLYTTNDLHKPSISNTFIHTSKIDQFTKQQQFFPSSTARMINSKTNQSTKLGESTGRQNNIINATFQVLRRKQNKLSQSLQKITKWEDFYQIMCSGDFTHMGIKCYQHNNQLILYCVRDKKLLCPNCMYSNNPNKKDQKNQQKKTVEKNNTSIDIKQNNLQISVQKQNNAGKSLSTSKRKKKNNSTIQEAKQKNNSKQGHTKHEVKQSNKSIVQISADIKVWQTQIQQKVTSMGSCQGAYQRLKQALQKSKKTLLSQLDQQYDKYQRALSKKYSEYKKQIVDMTKPIQNQIQKIVNNYKIIKKLLLPNRYPVPFVKHCWLDKMKEIMQNQISTNPQQVGTGWLKNYESYVRAIISKFGNKKSEPI